MNILIIGCGNLGSVLANEFDRNGHDVSVVDEILIEYIFCMKILMDFL